MEKIKHLGIIIDGNRRWAKERNLPSQEGHRKGYEKVKEVIAWCKKKGIEILTVYAFSTENWKRSEEEINSLMKLLIYAFEKDSKNIFKEELKVNILGSREGLNQDVLKSIEKIEEDTKNNKKGIFNIAFNYGGRQEILEALKKIIDKKIDLSEITEETISENLFTAGQPDPDLIIRTSGEKRLSGFLTWQSVYSEIYFCEPNWPDFSEDEFNKAIEEYGRRKRRFGGN